MNYYRCSECKTLFVGWGTSEFCSKCNGRLVRISEEEYEEEKDYQEREHYREVNKSES